MTILVISNSLVFPSNCASKEKEMLEKNLNYISACHWEWKRGMTYSWNSIHAFQAANTVQGDQTF